MLLTRASEYALLSLDKIRKSDKPMGAEKLAKELSIPKSFLAKILHNLAKRDILESHRGAQGGFIIKNSLSQISVYDIIIAAEGRIPSVFDCTQYISKLSKWSYRKLLYFTIFDNFQRKVDSFLP